ncbi:MAG: AbrB/MazE/SpoVT family DNA-binding domain-containing protein [Spirochaetota bacterium]
MSLIVHDFIHNRKRLKVKQALSHGLPQGSFLGALLTIHLLTTTVRVGIVCIFIYVWVLRQPGCLSGGNMLELNDGTCVCGTVKVGERGQIVIPKEARDYFGIKPGDSLVVFGNKKKGLSIFKAETLKDFAEFLINSEDDEQ